MPNLMSVLSRLPQRETHRHGIPILPGSLPLVGHAYVLIGDSLTTLREAAARLGPVFWMGDTTGEKLSLVCMGEPGFELLKNKVTSSEFIREQAPDFIGDALLSRDGAPHRSLRTPMSGPFTPRGLNSSGAAALSAEVVEACVTGLPQGPFSLLAETQRLALDVIFRVMGIDRSELATFNEHYREFILGGFPIRLDFPYSPLRRSRQGRMWLDAKFGQLITAARGQPIPGTLSALLAVRDEAGQGLGDTDLVQNLRLLALAGHETSASVMAWLGLVLAQRPDLWEKLREEATAAPGLPRSPEELKRHPFAEALFREVLRLYPPVAFTGRQTTEDLTLHGKHVPKGTMVTIPIGAYGYDPELYPDPERFEPTRWMGRRQPPRPSRSRPSEAVRTSASATTWRGWRWCSSPRRSRASWRAGG